MPYTVAAREVMETCGSVEDFDRWLHSHPQTSRGLLLTCDPKKQRVYEITTKNIGVRKPDDGLLFCTNHYRLAPMATPNAKCLRYADGWKRSQEIKRPSVDDVAKLLNVVNQGLR